MSRAKNIKVDLKICTYALTISSRVHLNYKHQKIKTHFIIFFFFDFCDGLTRISV